MATSPPISDRPLRRDAERNRQRILEAARDAFAEEGLSVTLDEIARRAGVGVGTVYRRFPDKEQLIEALFEDQMQAFVAMADECLVDVIRGRGSCASSTRPATSTRATAA